MSADEQPDSVDGTPGADRAAAQLGLSSEQRSILVDELRNALLPAVTGPAASRREARAQDGIARLLALADALAAVSRREEGG